MTILRMRSLIFECAFEDKNVKYSIYEQIEKHCGCFKVIVSTTSAMSPETLNAGLKTCPEKLVVAHPFLPPHLVPFVELVRAAITSDDAVQTAYDMLESLRPQGMRDEEERARVYCKPSAACAGARGVLHDRPRSGRSA